MEENRLYETPVEGFSLCMWVRERLPDLQEGYLDAMTAEAVRAHLSVCYLCQKEYSEMEQTVKLVETLPFVEPAKDFAPKIMAALQSQAQPGHSFRSPVVEVETEALRRVSEPRTTTGQQRQDEGLGIDLRAERTPLQLEQTGGWLDRRGLSALYGSAGEHLPAHERALAALALMATALALIASPWGRALLGPLGAASQWAGRLLGSIASVPVLGGAVTLLQRLLVEAGGGAARCLEMLASNPTAAVSIFSLAFAGAYYLRASRQPAYSGAY